MALELRINTLGYPKAALFAFCLALVSYNVLSTVKAALRSVHGEKASDAKVSGYDLAEEVAGTYRGMMIAVPKDEWVVFHGSRSHPESGRSVYKLGPRNNGNPRANPTEAVSLLNTSYFHLLIPMLQDQHFLV